MKIVLCDDHPIFRQALCLLVGSLSPEFALFEVSSARELRALCHSESGLGLLLLDLELSDGHGLDLLPEILPHFSRGVVMISASESSVDIQEALAKGASGFVPKSTSLAVLKQAIQLILSGGTYIPPEALGSANVFTRTPSQAALPDASVVDSESSDSLQESLTPRQREIITLATRGLTNKEIGEILEISENTIKAHLRAVYRVLNVSNRTEATMIWMQDGQ